MRLCAMVDDGEHPSNCCLVFMDASSVDEKTNTLCYMRPAFKSVVDGVDVLLEKTTSM